MTDRLFACLSATSEHWSVGATADDPVLLLGWPLQGKVDAGVPVQVASVVAAALTALYEVSLPVASAPSPDRASRALELQSASLWNRALGREQRWLVTTRDPQLVQAAFDDEHFPWWHQGQVLLLSKAGTSVDAAATLMRSLLRNPMNAPRSVLHQHHVEAIVVPGIDGDVIGVRGASEATRRACFDAVVQAATQARVALKALDEAEFSGELASQA